VLSRHINWVEDTQKRNHPDTGYALSRLAMLHYHDFDDFDPAESLWRRALEIYEKALRPDCQEVAIILANLGLLLRSKGDEVAAESLYRRALGIYEQALGLDHSDTVSIVKELAETMEARRNYMGAEQLYRRVKAFHEKSLGSEHWCTVKSLNNLAVCLCNKGDYVEAEMMFRDALTRFSLIYGEVSLEVASSHEDLGKLLHLTERLAEAHEHYTKCLAIRLEKLSEDDEEIKLIKESIDEINVAMREK